MIKDALITLYTRDITALKKEISAYSDENAMWIVKEGISNSAGNLCLHLIGNLNHFIGATLGKTGYIRERDKEFSQKNIPRSELLVHIDKALEVVTTTLQSLSPADLEKDFPLEFLGKIEKTDFMLLHLAAHLNYHLGQINYHRRLIA